MAQARAVLFCAPLGRRLKIKFSARHGVVLGEKRDAEVPSETRTVAARASPEIPRRDRAVPSPSQRAPGLLAGARAALEENERERDDEQKSETTRTMTLGTDTLGTPEQVPGVILDSG